MTHRLPCSCHLVSTAPAERLSTHIVCGSLFNDAVSKPATCRLTNKKRGIKCLDPDSNLTHSEQSQKHCRCTFTPCVFRRFRKISESDYLEQLGSLCTNFHENRNLSFFFRKSFEKNSSFFQNLTRIQSALLEDQYAFITDIASKFY